MVPHKLVPLLPHERYSALASAANANTHNIAKVTNNSGNRLITGLPIMESSGRDAIQRGRGSVWSPFDYLSGSQAGRFNLTHKCLPLPVRGALSCAALTPGSPFVRFGAWRLSVGPATATNESLRAGRWQGLALVQLSDLEPGFVYTTCPYMIHIGRKLATTR